MRRTKVCVLAVALSSAAGAWGTPPEIQVAVGFDRYGVAAEAIPVRVDLTATSGPLQGTLEVPMRKDRVGLPRDLYTTAIDVPTGGTKRYWLTVWPGRYQAEIEVRLRLGRAGVWSGTEPLRMVDSRVRLVGVISPSGSGLRFLNRLLSELDIGHGAGRPSAASAREDEKAGPPPLRVINLAIDELPPHDAAYNSLHALVISDDRFAAADPEVKEAVEHWVRGGGRLVLVGGVASAGLWQDEMIDRLSPVETTGTAFATRADLRPLITAFGGSFRAGGNERYALSRVVRVRRGEVLLKTGELPLAVESSYGSGAVTFLAMPHDEPPLRGWNGQEAMWRRLLQADQPTALSEGQTYWPLLRDAVIRLPAVATPASGLVAAFLLAYLIVLIPIQFPLLKRIGRRELAWVTTPLIVLVFSVGAYLIGVGAKGREVLVSTIAYIDATAGRPEARSVSATAVFSPAKESYGFDLPPFTSRIAELSDRSNPYGYRSSVEDSLSERSRLTIEQRVSSQHLVDVNIDMWALRVFGVERWRDLGGKLFVNVRRQNGRLKGAVSNGLAVPLRKATLMLDGRATPLGDLMPGTKHPIDVPLAGDASGAPSAGLGEKAGPPPGFTTGDSSSGLASCLLPCPSKHFDPGAVETAFRKLLGGADDYRYYGYDQAIVLPLDRPALWGWIETSGGPLKLASGRGVTRELALVQTIFQPAGG